MSALYAEPIRAIKADVGGPALALAIGRDVGSIVVAAATNIVGLEATVAIVVGTVAAAAGTVATVAEVVLPQPARIRTARGHPSCFTCAP